MNEEIITAMQSQVAKKFRFDSWQEFMKKAKKCQMQIGDFSIYPEEFKNVFSEGPTEKSEFDIGDNMILVPYYSGGHGFDSKPIAFYNMVVRGEVKRSLECAVLYSKIDPEQPAYLLYIEAEVGLSMHKF
jgi:hypothetical protein